MKSSSNSDKYCTIVYKDMAYFCYTISKDIGEGLSECAVRALSYTSYQQLTL